MSNISKKAASLQAILEKHNLLQKSASEILHIKSPENQGAEGKTQQAMIELGCGGDYASNAEASAITDVPQDYVDGQDECSKTTLSLTGTTVKHIDTAGNAQGTPAQVAKTAALRQKLQACVLNQLRKEAAYIAEQLNKFISATEVMSKVAALANLTDQNAIDMLTSDILMDFRRLNKSNPLFGPACEYVAMRKMAALISALAAALGIDEEQAAAALDAAMANDPEAQAEFNNEVEGEALSELADAEQQTENLMAGLDLTAAKVSEMTGENITAEDIIAAVQDVAAEAEARGVEPEVLIQEAAEQMMGGSALLVTPEDEAIAEQLLEEAAAQGISPLELIQGLAGELLGTLAPAATEEVPAKEEPAATEEAPAQEEPAKEEPSEEEVQKTACLKKLASTKRGANLLKVLTGM